jgi:hypothetical protein
MNNGLPGIHDLNGILSQIWVSQINVDNIDKFWLFVLNVSWWNYNLYYVHEARHSSAMFHCPKSNYPSNVCKRHCILAYDGIKWFVDPFKMDCALQVLEK